MVPPQRCVFVAGPRSFRARVAGPAEVNWPTARRARPGRRPPPEPGCTSTLPWPSEPSWPEASKGTWPKIAISGSDAVYHGAPTAGQRFSRRRLPACSSPPQGSECPCPQGSGRTAPGHPMTEYGWRLGLCAGCDLCVPRGTLPVAHDRPGRSALRGAQLDLVSVGHDDAWHGQATSRVQVHKGRFHLGRPRCHWGSVHGLVLVHPRVFDAVARCCRTADAVPHFAGPHRGRHEDRPGTRRRRTAIGAGEGDSSVRGNRPGRGGGHCVNISGTDRTRGRCQKSAADSHDAGSNKTSSHLLISLIVRTFLQLNEMPRGWKRRPEQLWRAIRHLAVAIRDQGRHERPPGRSLPCPHRAARPCFTSPRGRGSGVRCVLSACRASRRCGLIQPRPWAAVQALLKHGLRAPEELARAGQGPPYKSPESGAC